MGHPVIYSGWGKGTTGALDLTPVPPVHALLAQIHLASKSAPEQWPELASAGQQANVSTSQTSLPGSLV